MRKKIFLFFVLSACLFIPTRAVFADAPARPQSIEIFITDKTDVPKIFIDLLVNADTQSQVHKGQLNADFSANHPNLVNSELINYDTDGWVSYSAYFEGATSKYVDLGNNETYYDFASGTMNEIKAFKAVACDESGHILSISDTVDLSSTSHSTFFENIYYSVTNNSFSVNNYAHHSYNILGIFAALFLIILSNILFIAFTIVIEILIAKFFKIRPLYKIFLINLVSELLLNLGMALMELPYVYEVIIMEIFVYLFEFLCVRYYIRDKRTLRTVLFVFVANTVTLTLGLLIIHLNLFPLIQ